MRTCAQAGSIRAMPETEIPRATRVDIYFLWRRHPDLNRGIKVLQTLALPLGYSAIEEKKQREPLCVGAGNET